MLETICETFRFFKTIPPSELELFLLHCEHLKVPVGTTLWLEGDSECYMAFVLEGKIGIKKRTEFGDRQVIVGIHSAGSLVGEYNLLNPIPRAVSAEVIETAELLILHSPQFESLLIQAPQLGIQLLRQISLSTAMRLNQSYERLAAIF